MIIWILWILLCVVVFAVCLQLFLYGPSFPVLYFAVKMLKIILSSNYFLEMGGFASSFFYRSFMLLRLLPVYCFNAVCILCLIFVMVQFRAGHIFNVG